MSNRPTIRPAKPCDAAPLENLIHRVLRVSNTPDYGIENVERVVSHFTKDGIAEMIARNYTLVAEMAGAIVGTASLGTSASMDTQAIRTFFVDPSVQRTGVGTALLCEIEARARADGLTELPVRSSIAGEAFYASHGYGAVQDHWEGDERTIQMQKRLT